jgi:hypothetical protein
MTFIPETLIITGAILGLCLAAPAQAQAQQNSGQLFHCQNDQRSWTLYESASARMFHQEIGVMGPGSFTLDIMANGFGFEGFTYTRPSAWDKWQYVNKTNKGQRNWSHTWRVPKDDTRSFLLQLIKDNNGCPNCTITMRMRTSQCARPRPRPSRTSRPSKPCAVNYCMNGQGLYGVPACTYRPGWDGSACR